VAVRWDALEIDAVFREGLFEVVGALIVEDMEFGCEPVQLELGV
jgi:hypothetical protein